MQNNLIQNLLFPFYYGYIYGHIIKKSLTETFVSD